MYYKEAWINGKLCCKSTPDGEWIPFTIGQYKERVKQLEEQVKNLTLAAVSNNEVAVCYMFRCSNTGGKCDYCGKEQWLHK